MSVFTACFRSLLATGLVWLAIGMTTTASAHPADFTRLLVTVQDDGDFEATVNFEVFSHVLGERVSEAGVVALRGESPAELAAQLTEANERFRREVVVRTDAGEAAMPAAGWRYPELATLKKELVLSPALSGEITFAGHLPAGARTLSVRLPYTLGEIIDIYQLPGGRTQSAPVAAGEYGPEIALPESAPPLPTGGVFARYVWLGFVHILPKGLDHILFVLGLYLLSPKLRPLLWQVSAFTLAHSLTLALSIYGIFSLPSSIVEPIIAVSIVFIALENVFTTGLHAWRPTVVFVFGLLHGLGFAGVLTELGLPENARLTALIGFNAGVECGQLAVIALAFLAVGWFGKKAWYRRRIVIPASLLIALVALDWTVQRLLASSRLAHS